MARFQQAQAADKAVRISYKPRKGEIIEYATPCSAWQKATVLQALSNSGKYGGRKYKIKVAGQEKQAHAANLRSMEKGEQVDLWNIPKGTKVDFYNTAYTSPDDVWLNAVTKDVGERKPWPIEGGQEVETMVYPVRIEDGPSAGTELDSPMWMF